MEEKDLLRKIKWESELHAPDMYNKIINAANAQGLFKSNAFDEEAYSDGETVVLGGVNKKAAVIVSLASVAAICLTIALPIALSGSPSLPLADNKIVADIDLGDSYSYGAVTTARLAESFFSEPAGAKAMAKTMADSSVSSDDFNEFGTYFTALDCFFNDSGVNKAAAPKPADYQKSITLSGLRLNGDEFNYAMYYTEYKIVQKNYVSGDPVNYYLEGVINASWASGLSLVGERTLSSDAADAEETALKLYAYPNLNDKTTYALMQLQFIEIDNVTIKGYSYKIVSDGTTISEAVAYTPADNDLVIKIKDGKDDKGIFTVKGKAEGGQGYNVDYAIGNNAGLFTVKYTDNGLEYVSPETPVDPDIDVLKYRDNGDGTYSVSSYDKNAKLPETLIVPATFNDAPVVSIVGGALTGSSFKKVIISDGITRIEREAFKNCRLLSEVEFPSTLNYIGEYAFYNTNLVELNLPESLRTISQEAFADCDYLTKVDIPNGVEMLGSQTFFSCYGLKSVSLPASLKFISYGVFSWCGSLTEITVAKDNPVYRSVNNCVIDTEKRELVAGCNTSVIPADGSVEIINCLAFAGCNFKTFNLPSTITELQDDAFFGCELSSFNIPQNVSYIGSGVFGGCNYLEELTVDANNTTYFSSQNCIIERGTKTLVAGCKASVIPDDGSVEIIGNGSFNSSYIQEIFIPLPVKEIASSAFSYSDVKKVIMEGVEVIGNSAFSNCYYLESVTFSDNLKHIYGSAFSDCTQLQSIELPQGLISLWYGAFTNCTSLQTAYLPKGLTYIDSEVFYNCTRLETITIHNTVQDIGFQSFYNCSSLRTIYFVGTYDEWEAIQKDTNTWDSNIGPYQVICIRED